MIHLQLNLDEMQWNRFEEICREEGENPDQVLQKWIDEYSKKNSPEYRLAQSIVEAEKILEGKAKGIDAYKLLEEI